MPEDESTPTEFFDGPKDAAPMPDRPPESTRQLSDCDAVPSDADLEKWNALEKLIRLALQPEDGDGAQPAPDFDIPRQIGRFNIIATLGSGGGGVVYKGLDPILNRVVAVKVLHAHLAVSRDFQQRFLQEGKILSELSHSGIVAIHEVGYHRELPFLIFEYCSGGSLSDWLENQTLPMAPRTCARIALVLAWALQHAHARGVLHRDVNPKNVLLIPLSNPLPEDREFPYAAKLSDFGLGTWFDEQKSAVHTQTGAVMGTLYYMAPEQSRANTAGWQPTLDVYALGVILYEMLTGRRPFSGKTPVETLSLIQEQDPVPPRQLRKEIPRDLETICLKCLEKEPHRRFALASDLALDLERFLSGDPILSRRASWTETTLRWANKKRLQIGTAVVMTVLVSALGMSAHFLRREIGKSTEVVQASEKKSRDFNTRLMEIEERKRSIEKQRIAETLAQQEKQRRLEYNLQIATIARTGDYRSFSTIQKLRRFIPQSADESDLRGFEWYYLMRRFGGDCVMMNHDKAWTDPIEAMHVSETGESVFLAQRQLLTEWQIQHQQKRRVVHQAQLTIRDFAISQQLNRLAISGCEYPEIRLYELSSLREIPIPQEQPPVGRWCNQLEFHATTGDLYSISAVTSEFHHPCRIDRTGLDSVRESLDIAADNCRVIDFTFDGTTNQLIHSADNQIQVLPASGYPAQTLDVTDSKQDFVTSLAISNDSQTLAVATDRGDIVLYRKTASNQWKLDVRLPVTNLRSTILPEHHSLNRVPIRFNRTGDRLYTPGEHDLRLWDLRENREICWITDLPGGPVRYVELLNQGQTAVWTTDYYLGLWNPIEDLPQIEGHRKEAWSVAFSPVAAIIATGSDDHTVRIWNIATGQMLKELSGHQATVNRVAFSPQGDKLASISLDGTIRIWDARIWNQIQLLQGGKVTFRSLAWFADGQRIVVTISPTESDRPHQIQVWDLKQGRLLNTLDDAKRRIHSVQITSDQQNIIATSDDGGVRVWNAMDGTLFQSWAEDEKPGCSILMNRENWLVCGVGQGMMRIRDLKSGSVIRDFSGHAHPVLSLAVSPDGRILASGSIDNTVRLWDIETGHCLLVFEEQQAQINSVAFSPDGSILASAAHDGSVKLRYAPRFTPLPGKWRE